MKIWLRENDLKRDLKFTEADKALDQLLQSTKKTVHEFFCDNFNIPSALVALFELIKKTYDLHQEPIFEKNIESCGHN